MAKCPTCGGTETPLMIYKGTKRCSEKCSPINK